MACVHTFRRHDVDGRLVYFGIGLPQVNDLVMGLHDEDVEPDTDVGGDHVHEAEPGDNLVLVDIHLEHKVIPLQCIFLLGHWDAK